MRGDDFVKLLNEYGDLEGLLGSLTSVEREIAEPRRRRLEFEIDQKPDMVFSVAHSPKNTLDTKSDSDGWARTAHIKVCQVKIRIRKRFYRGCLGADKVAQLICDALNQKGVEWVLSLIKEKLEGDKAWCQRRIKDALDEMQK